MQKWTISDFVNYFETMKTKGIVDSVFPVDVNDININQELKSNSDKGYTLVLTYPEIDGVGQTVDCNADRWNCMLFILTKVNNKTSNSYTARTTAISECLNVCRQIREDMFENARADVLCYPLKSINPNSFKFQKMGPVFNNMYGYAMSFNFDN